MTEQWLLIEETGGRYSVSNLGRVRCEERISSNQFGEFKVRPRVLKNYINSNGYSSVVVYDKSGKRLTRPVHVLVMNAFVGKRPQGAEVAHGDGNRANPRLDNLRYATRSENMLDMVRHGTRKYAKGSDHPMAILSEDKVKAIYGDTRTLQAIGDAYGVSMHAIWRIKRGKIWAHLYREHFGITGKPKELERA